MGMRVATWNLARAKPFGRARADAMRRHMEAVDADVWVLTETWQGFAPSPEHAMIACSEPAADRDAPDGECWVAIWSRLPAAPVELAGEPDRCAATRVTEPGGRSWICVGTVLPWLSDPRRRPVTGSAAFVAGLAEQSANWRRLAERDSDAALIVAGDFNQDLADRHYYGSKAGRAALRQALERCDLVCLTAGERDPLRSRPGRASIDHICVSRRRITGREEVGAWPEGDLPPSLTDHYGAWMALPG